MPENHERHRVLSAGIGVILALGSLTLGNRTIMDKELPAKSRPGASGGHVLAAQCVGPILSAAGGCFTAVHEGVPEPAPPVSATSNSLQETPVTATTEVSVVTTVPIPEAKPVVTTVPVTRPPTTKAPVAQATESEEGTNLGAFESTCYSLDGITASGRPVGPGIVAVDPRIIPLGTRLMVEGYGTAIAADTGGAIKGKIIDVWMPTDSQCYAWGRQVVQVSIVG